MAYPSNLIASSQLQAQVNRYIKNSREKSAKLIRTVIPPKKSAS